MPPSLRSCSQALAIYQIPFLKYSCWCHHHLPIMKQVSSVFAIIFLTFFHLVQAAFDAAIDRDCTYSSPCLTSFVCCDRSGDNKGCSYPEDAYPLYDRKEPSNPAMLISTSNYTISWKQADSNYPVRLQWMITQLGEGSTLVPGWDFSKSIMPCGLTGNLRRRCHKDSS